MGNSEENNFRVNSRREKSSSTSIGSSLKRLRNHIVEGLQQMFLSNNFPIDVIQAKIAMTQLN